LDIYILRKPDLSATGSDIFAVSVEGLDGTSEL
jgi:hypothetical protein